MMQSLKHDDQTRVFVTLWAIWHARRKAIHEQIFQSPLTVHMFVENFVSDLNLSEQEKKKQAPAMHVPTNEGWIPPPSGMAKINVDASVGKKSIRGAVAAVARNKLGEFLGASATIFKGRTDAETLEALACREAVELARDLNLHKIRVATDCQNVVRSL
jgi:hypothetical protein